MLAESILEELREKLTTKFKNTDEEADAVLTGFRRLATIVALSGQSGWVSADPDDDKFVEAAIVADADVIVSSDQHLLELTSIAGITIVSPREFLHQIASEGE